MPNQDFQTRESLKKAVERESAKTSLSDDFQWMAWEQGDWEQYMECKGVSNRMLRAGLATLGCDVDVNSEPIVFIGLPGVIIKTAIDLAERAALQRPDLLMEDGAPSYFIKATHEPEPDA